MEKEVDFYRDSTFDHSLLLVEDYENDVYL